MQKLAKPGVKTNMKKLPITRENATITLLCSAICLIFTLLWLLPAASRHQRMVKELPDAEQKIQEILQVKEINTSLDETLKSQPRHEDAGAMEQLPLMVDNATAFIDEVKEIAGQLTLHEKELVLKIIPGSEKSRQELQITAVYQGEINNCRLLLQSLLHNTHVKEVTTIRITATDKDVQMDIHFTIEVV